MVLSPLLDDEVGDTYSMKSQKTLKTRDHFFQGCPGLGQVAAVNDRVSDKQLMIER